MPDRRRTTRLRPIAAGAAGVCLLGMAAACSGSSSPSAKPTKLPTVAATANLHGHNAGGPDGVITAPASNAPGVGEPGGSEVFPHVTNAERVPLDNRLVKMAGVVRATYYPQFHQLQVYYTATATAEERQAVIQAVKTAPKHPKKPHHKHAPKH